MFPSVYYTAVDFRKLVVAGLEPPARPKAERALAEYRARQTSGPRRSPPWSRRRGGRVEWRVEG